MDIKALKYFLAVAQERNITKAAEKLCMAQPPLSRQMKILEEELGVTLFIRGKRQIQLTEEGYYLKQQAEEIILLVEKTEQQLGKMGGSEHGTLSIGATEVCGASILSEMLEQFHIIAPMVHFQIWSGNGDEIRDRLEKNLVDVGIVREPFNMENYDRAFLRREPWIAVFSKEHPLAEGTEGGIEISMLKEEPLMIPIRQPIQNEINSWFNEMVTERNIFCLYNSLISVMGLVEHGLGIAICPESARSLTNREKLVYRKIIRPEHESQIFLVKKRFQVMTTASELFWKFALDYASEKKSPFHCIDKSEN